MDIPGGQSPARNNPSNHGIIDDKSRVSRQEFLAPFQPALAARPRLSIGELDEISSINRRNLVAVTQQLAIRLANPGGIVPCPEIKEREADSRAQAIASALMSYAVARELSQADLELS